MINSFLNGLKCANRRARFIQSFSRQSGKNHAVDLNQKNNFWIAHWGPNPTVDYFFRAPSKKVFADATFIDISGPGLINQPPAHAILIVVRYLSNPLIALLEAHKTQGGKIVFFMDDDLPENMCSSKLPHSYRDLIWARFGDHMTKLEKLFDELWVSTPELSRRYAYANPRIINPSYFTPEPTSEFIFYFYHGSPSTHRQEIEWLRAVVEQTQSRSENLIFMIMGDRQVKKLFSDLPRTMVFHPMPWETYRDLLPALPHHIGLAPLLPTELNRTRSPTRFFDMTRLGAVGIYTNSEPYKDVVENQVDGYLLANDAAIWSEQIISLAQQPETIEIMLKNAQVKCQTLTNSF